MTNIPKDVVEKEAEQLFENWPSDDAAGSEFFFTGGSTEIRNSSSTSQSLSSQLMGVQNIKDLKRGGGVPNPAAHIEVVDDLDDFVVDRVEIVEDSQYEDLFFAVKSKIYARFDFIRILSMFFGDVPMTARDLVLNSGDFHLIEYLKTTTTDYFAVSQLAYLYALDTMGVDTVRFREQDGCPICSAHDGVLYSVRNVLNLLSSGEFLTHPYCECQWDPVIYREMYSGPLEGNLNLPDYNLRNGLVLKSVPIEMKSDIEDSLDGWESDFDSVSFINIGDYILNEVDDVDDSSGVVVVDHAGTLVVHNSYVDRFGPADFIREFRKAKLLPKVVDVNELKGSQVYFIGGRSAYHHEGRYWDINTGECLS